MDDFDRLLALTRAAEGCNGLARQFIDRFGDEPEFSRFLSAEGQPYCQPAADSQAKQHMDDAHREAAALREEARRWDQAYGAHDAVLRAAVGLRLPVIEFNGSTYPTAHEAARHFAQAVSEVLYRIEGYGDIEHSFELARLLADFRPAPDYYGQIQQESIAAEEFVTIAPDREEYLGAEDAHPANDDDEPKFYVTLQQMASMVQRSKRTLERIKDQLPPPDIKAPVNGAPDEWLWSTVRPILEKKFARTLPESFPRLTK